MEKARFGGNCTHGEAPTVSYSVWTTGVNDHTLYEPVPALKSHTWGFCEGLYKRIFLHVRPGDVLLFTSAGSGKFNLVGK